MDKKLPDFKYERELWAKGFVAVGIDEVGRGALAGPMYVGAYVLLPPLINEAEERVKKLLDLGVDDSKKLTIGQRESLSSILKLQECVWAVSSIDERTIDKIGMTAATQIAIKMAVENIIGSLPLRRKIYLLLDAFKAPSIKGVELQDQLALVRADEKIFSVASASIIAKVARDGYMRELAKEYPHYFWDKNKGYGTKYHLQAIKNYGSTKYHRRLFLRKLNHLYKSSQGRNG